MIDSVTTHGIRLLGCGGISNQDLLSACLVLEYIQLQPIMALLVLSTGVLKYLWSSGTLAYAPLMFH